MIAKPVSTLAHRTCIAATIEAAKNLDKAKRKEFLKQISGVFNFNDPSVTGFITEGIVISCLKSCDWASFNGFNFDGWPAKPAEIVLFPGEGYQLQGNFFTPTLLVPLRWDFPLVDAVIVYQHEDHCYVVGIQITTKKPVNHAHSYEFVTDPRCHTLFVPESYLAGKICDNSTPAKYSVGLLWIVPQKDVGDLPANGDRQGVISLEFFESECGVPIP